MLPPRRHDLFHHRYDLLGPYVERAGHVCHRAVEDSVVCAYFRKLVEVLDGLVRGHHHPLLARLVGVLRHTPVPRHDEPDTERGLLYLAIRPPFLLTALTQHVVLSSDVICTLYEDVARVRVLRDQPERLLLARTPYHDRRVWPLDRIRRVEGLTQPVVLPLEVVYLVRPHHVRDLQCLFKHLK